MPKQSISWHIYVNDTNAWHIQRIWRWIWILNIASMPENALDVDDVLMTVVVAMVVVAASHGKHKTKKHGLQGTERQIQNPKLIICYLLSRAVSMPLSFDIIRCHIHLTTILVSSKMEVTKIKPQKFVIHNQKTGIALFFFAKITITFMDIWMEKKASNQNIKHQKSTRNTSANVKLSAPQAPNVHFHEAD